MENKNISILELFGGIGACTKALKNIGLNVNVVDYVEIDKYAVKSYNAINNTNFEPQDITKWNKDINIDLIMHGSPCQDFSIAGKQAGGDEGSGTRSSLMYETIRIIEKLHPKYIIWENVKNLLSKKHKHNFDNYINKLDKLGYNSYYQILDAQDYGVPQHRERVYTISIRKDIDNKTFEFPKKEELILRLKDMLENEVDEKYYLSAKMLEGFEKHNKKHKEKGTGFIWKPKTEDDIASTLRANGALCPTDNTIKVIGKCDIKGHDCVKPVYSGEGLAPTLTDMQGGNRQPKIIEDFYKNRTPREYSEVSPTLRSERIGLKVKCYEENYRIRKLTPKECWRLMGFDDEDFDKAQAVPTSNTQLYKQAGNSIVVKVLEKIFLNLFKGD